MKLFTVGYERCAIDDFVKELSDLGIKYVADLRKRPLSRKRGFSKKMLSEKLAEAGIEYSHWPSLGVPTLWRKQAKAGRITREKMFQDYARKILPEEKETVTELKKIMRQGPLALLCYEAEASDCHRHFVADLIKKSSRVRVVNLELQAAQQMKGSLLAGLPQKARRRSLL